MEIKFLLGEMPFKDFDSAIDNCSKRVSTFHYGHHDPLGKTVPVQIRATTMSESVKLLWDSTTCQAAKVLQPM